LRLEAQAKSHGDCRALANLQRNIPSCGSRYLGVVESIPRCTRINTSVWSDQYLGMVEDGHGEVSALPLPPRGASRRHAWTTPGESLQRRVLTSAQ